MNNNGGVVGPAIVIPIIVILAVAGTVIATGEWLLFLAEDFGQNVSIAVATAMMFAYTGIAWLLGRE
jgi:hypothetical protein